MTFEPPTAENPYGSYKPDPDAEHLTQAWLWHDERLAQLERRVRDLSIATAILLTTLIIVGLTR